MSTRWPCAGRGRPAAKGDAGPHRSESVAMVAQASATSGDGGRARRRCNFFHLGRGCRCPHCPLGPACLDGDGGQHERHALVCTHGPYPQGSHEIGLSRWRIHLRGFRPLMLSNPSQKTIARAATTSLDTHALAPSRTACSVALSRDAPFLTMWSMSSRSWSPPPWLAYQRLAPSLPVVSSRRLASVDILLASRRIVGCALFSTR